MKPPFEAKWNAYVSQKFSLDLTAKFGFSVFGKGIDAKLQSKTEVGGKGEIGGKKVDSTTQIISTLLEQKYSVEGMDFPDFPVGMLDCAICTRSKKTDVLASIENCYRLALQRQGAGGLLCKGDWFSFQKSFCKEVEPCINTQCPKSGRKPGKLVLQGLMLTLQSDDKSSPPDRRFLGIGQWVPKR